MIGIVKLIFLFLTTDPKNKHKANIGVKFGGCGINLETIAAKIIPNIAMLFISIIFFKLFIKKFKSLNRSNYITFSIFY